MVKIYICGLCKKRGIRFVTDRKGLQKHLREEHFIKHELTNKKLMSGKNETEKQKWWLTEEWT